MGFKEVADLDCSNSTAIGGTDKKTGKRNPTEITGYYIGTRQVASPKSKTGFASLHVLQTDKGNTGVWGKTNLDQKMTAVKPGQLIRVSFVGMVETKNNPMYKYKVEIDASQTIEVAGGSDNSGADDSGTSDGGGSYSDDGDDTDLDDDAPLPDETPPARAAAPKTRAAAPAADRQAHVQKLLGSRTARS